jgi:hypothetical protein
MSTQIKTKWFWLWQDEQEEEWLRSMAKQGLHLKEIRLLNRYVFEESTPQDIVYRLDFFTANKDYPGYQQLFRDAGWEHVAVYGSWQYFRKPAAAGASLEIFTDTDSKVQKYQRIVAILVVFMAVFLTSLGSFDPARYGWFGALAQGLRFLLMIAIMVNLIMLAKRIVQLRKKV